MSKNELTQINPKDRYCAKHTPAGTYCCQDPGTKRKFMKYGKSDSMWGQEYGICKFSTSEIFDPAPQAFEKYCVCSVDMDGNTNFPRHQVLNQEGQIIRIQSTSRQATKLNFHGNWIFMTCEHLLIEGSPLTL